MSAPWFVGGGAKHSPETARLLANAATSDSEGIVAPGDYKVRPLAVPGAGVLISAGSAVLRAAPYTGGRSQSYMTRRAADTQVATTTTGSGAARSDLVIQRIDDPQFSGNLVPTDPNAIFDPFVIITGVPAGTRRVSDLSPALPYPAIELARIDRPANTSAVGLDSIVDLRRLVQPRESRVLESHQYNAGQEIGVTTEFLTFTEFQPMIEVPRWATAFRQVATINGMAQHPTVSSEGQLRVLLGSVGGAASRFDFDPVRDGMRHTVGTSNGSDNITAIAGTTQQIMVQARCDSGLIAVHPSTHIVIDTQFYERAV